MSEWPAVDHITDPIYSVGSVIWKGQRRLVEYHGGSFGHGLDEFHATDALTGMSLRIPYARTSDLGWKRMPADRWTAQTGITPPRADHGVVSDPWWLQRVRDPIVRFCSEYEARTPVARGGSLAEWLRADEGEDRLSDRNWLVLSMSEWSFRISEGERLVDLLWDLFWGEVVQAAGFDEGPAPRNWSEVLEASGFGPMARVLMHAMEASPAVPEDLPPEQLGLFSGA
ncbi:MAG: hypothetical protein ACYCZN_01615 [Candidatus Dormibacteria bacterium]